MNLCELTKNHGVIYIYACYVSCDIVTPLGRPDPSGVIRLEQAHARAYIYVLARSLRGTSISDRLRHIFSW